MKWKPKHPKTATTTGCAANSTPFPKIRWNAPPCLWCSTKPTCFLHREGPNGFNVSYGHYKKTPTIVSKEKLDRISDLIIQDVEYIHTNFQESINAVQPGDFVYIDPPYVPLNPNAFVWYVRNGFRKKRHQALFDEYNDWYYSRIYYF